MRETTILNLWSPARLGDPSECVSAFVSALKKSANCTLVVMGMQRFKNKRTVFKAGCDWALGSNPACCAVHELESGKARECVPQWQLWLPLT